MGKVTFQGHSIISSNRTFTFPGCGYGQSPATLPEVLGKSYKRDYGRNKEQPLGHDVLQTPL